MKLLTAAVITLFLLLAPFCSMAQELFNPGSRAQAMGGVAATLADCWSVFGNQAGLANIHQPELAGSFQSRFLINELALTSGLVVIPVQSSVFAVSVYQFGKTPFRQNKIGLAYARFITPSLNIGFQFNYYRLSVFEDNRSVGLWGVELGLQYRISDEFSLGGHLTNPYQTFVETSSGDFKYPCIVNVGCMYRASESFLMVAEVENRFSEEVIVKTGLEYNLNERIFFRGGISGKPFQLSAGFGFQVKKLQIDLASAYHQLLGNSPSFSFKYRFNK
ncbi:MAG: hypothetical protein JNK09_00255 [Prolixibacteraceae bacterium]|nr:hypothetical protein [Prolixibacteraceae bacterium]